MSDETVGHAAVNTQVDAAGLAPALCDAYDLAAPATCEFIRRGFNDTYRVDAGPDRFVFRIYFDGKYYIQSPDDFRFELELLRHLSKEGIPAAAPIARRDGDLLGVLDTPSGPRCCALFAFGDGASGYDSPITVARATILGDAIAKMHAAADRFQTGLPRYHLNLRYLVDEPVRLIRRHLEHLGRDDLERHALAVAALRRELADTSEASDYGLIHGDLHGGNLVFTEIDDLTLFDFDHCGYGWRAYDLSVCRPEMPDDAWAAFLAAYRAARPISEREVAAIPAFRRVRTLWDMGDVLAMYPCWGREWADADAMEGIVGRLDRLFDGSNAP